MLYIRYANGVIVCKKSFFVVMSVAALCSGTQGVVGNSSPLVGAAPHYLQGSLYLGAQTSYIDCSNQPSQLHLPHKAATVIQAVAYDHKNLVAALNSKPDDVKKDIQGILDAKDISAVFRIYKSLAELPENNLLQNAQDERFKCLKMIIGSNTYDSHDFQMLCQQYGSSLMMAIKKDNTALALKLIKDHCEIGMRDNNDVNALMYAAMYDRLDCVKSLVAAKYEVGMRDNNGMTALMYAAKYGRLDCVKALINAGANIRKMMLQKLMHWYMLLLDVILSV